MNWFKKLKLKYKQYRCVHMSKIYDEPRPTKKDVRIGGFFSAHCEKCGKNLGNVWSKG